MSLSLATIEVYKPIIYVPRELPGLELEDVLYEIHNDHAILWYHWPRDGLENHADYEPVILFFRQQRLRAIATRRHRNHQLFDSWTREGLKPIIWFDGYNHGPVVLRGGLFDPMIRAIRRFSIRMDDYPITQGTFDPWFIRDGTAISIYDYGTTVSLSLT